MKKREHPELKHGAHLKFGGREDHIAGVAGTTWNKFTLEKVALDFATAFVSHWVRITRQ